MPCKIRVSKITISEEELIKLFLSFTTNPHSAVIVKEHIPKDHYHVYLDECLSPPTIRARLQMVCPTKGNDSYSVSTTHTDWKGYQGYLLKYDDTTVLHCHQDIQELKEYYESQSKSSKSSKRTDYTKIYNYVIAKSEADLRTREDPKVITKLILEFYIEEQKIFNKAHIAQILNTLWFQFHPSDEGFIDTVLEEANIRTQHGRRVVTKSTTYFQSPE